jgi:hypothetical protein
MLTNYINIWHFFLLFLREKNANTNFLKSYQQIVLRMVIPSLSNVQVQKLSWVEDRSVRKWNKYLGLGWGDIIGPSVDDQAVSLSDDGTTIIIDFFSLFLLSFYRHSTRHTLHLHFNPD